MLLDHPDLRIGSFYVSRSHQIYPLVFSSVRYIYCVTENNRSSIGNRNPSSHIHAFCQNASCLNIHLLDPKASLVVMLCTWGSVSAAALVLALVLAAFVAFGCELMTSLRNDVFSF